MAGGPPQAGGAPRACACSAVSEDDHLKQIAKRARRQTGIPSSAISGLSVICGGRGLTIGVAIRRPVFWIFAVARTLRALPGGYGGGLRREHAQSAVWRLDRVLVCSARAA